MREGGFSLLLVPETSMTKMCPPNKRDVAIARSIKNPAKDKTSLEWNFSSSHNTAQQLKIVLLVFMPSCLSKFVHLRSQGDFLCQVRQAYDFAKTVSAAVRPMAAAATTTTTPSK